MESQYDGLDRGCRAMNLRLVELAYATCAFDASSSELPHLISGPVDQDATV
ncbi:MAG: hypothetical protein FWD57_06635 [Polyangiaceae bacterium]|nr:hypothetical protein [Polyangiaceae bacterium]